VQGIEFLRVASGAGANTKVGPARVTDYVPDYSDMGGIFDDRVRARGGDNDCHEPISSQSFDERAHKNDDNQSLPS